LKNFLIYKSSAGSGKTYTLVKEYLRLALSKPDEFRHTLAITFTNKAAAEMKKRVIKKLGELAEGKDAKLAEILTKEGVKGNIKQLAQDVLSNILHKYSFFSVQTIDSFFHKVIRSFARELKLQLGYDIEMEPETVLDKLIDEIFDRIGEDENLRNYLENFVYYNIDEDGDWKIEYKVKNLSAEIFKERYWEKKENSNDDLADSRGKMLEFVSIMFAIVNSFEGTMNSISESANKIIEKYELTMGDFPFGKSGFMNYLLNKIRNKDYEPTSRVYDAYSNSQKWFTKIPHPNLHTAINEGLYDLLVKAVDNYEQNHRKYFSAKELTKTVYILGIFNDLLDRLKAYRDENKLLLISDTNIILKQIISNEPSPFIYEKIGNVFKNYLVDEFQDTSNYQWMNLLPLVINSISEGNFSMIVGDVKQSVYRWRSGNMKLLLEKVQEDLAPFKELISVEDLRDNWRSFNEIVKFNNNFFQAASKQLAEKNAEYAELIEESYKEVTQTQSGDKKGGYVKVDFIETEKENEKSTTERSDELTLNYVNQLIDDGFELRDIMILTRRNSEASHIAGLLTGNGYKVVSNDSLLITNSPRVKLLINLLKYISDSSNDIAKTEILFHYLVYIKEDFSNYKDIFEDHKKSYGLLFGSCLPKEFFSGIPNSNGINPKLNNLTLYELVENLVRIFELNAKADAYLQRFLDLVLEYVKKENSDITAFISWWEENKEKISIIVPEEENAIKVLTVHMAKGLQSPAVVIPYANWEFNISASRDLIWVSSGEEPFNRSSAYLVRAVSNLKNSYFQKDYEDEFVMTNIDNLNLLYVAFTRAIERLYVICPGIERNSFNASKLIKDSLPAEGTEYGRREKKKSKTAIGKINSVKFDSTISSGYSDKVVIQTKNSAIERGILIHRALANIIVLNDVERAVSKLISEGLIRDNDRDSYTKELTEIVNFIEVKEWFSGKWEIKSEPDILIPGGKTIRPDRVMINDNKAIVIDYKTGAQSKEHESQVNEYAGALLKAGFESVDKYVYYVSSGKVVKI
jgi:ATP-dependent helicase/nuclease subunit A